MEELIRKSDVVKVIDKKIQNTSDYLQHDALIELEADVEEIPTVEAVPVVRCKDCKHSDLPAVLTRKYGKAGTLTCHNRYGSCNNRNVNENDFCSAGELPEQI